MMSKMVKEALSTILFEGIKNTAVESGKELLKGASNELIGGVVLDTAASSIPIIGDIIRNTRINRRLSNIETFINEIRGDLDRFIKYNEQLSDEDREIYSELLEYAIDSVAEYRQEEKIKCLVNGLSSIIKNKSISFDMGYMYINMLEQLTLLDIEVIRCHYPYLTKDTIEDITGTFDITTDQYQAVRQNLYRLGLMQKHHEKDESKDLKNIEENLETLQENVANLHNYLTKLLKGKRNNRLPKLKSSKIKFETKDRFELSLFGREFCQYFLYFDEE